LFLKYFLNFTTDEKICTLPSLNGLGIFSPLLTAGVLGRYGLLAMGNGHAPGTAIGLGDAGA